MKRLIEELEAMELEYKSNASAADKDIAYGIYRARKFAESHNPWIPVSELPPLDEEPELSGQNESINVLFSDDSGYDCEVGYYDFDENKIVVSDGYEHHFTKWTYLPEIK